MAAAGGWRLLREGSSLAVAREAAWRGCGCLLDPVVFGHQCAARLGTDLPEDLVRLIEMLLEMTERREERDR